MDDKTKTTARIVGALFLIAMVTSIVGGLLLESILDVADPLASVSESETQVIVGVLLELTNGLAVIGIAVAMFPLLKEQSEMLALGYVALRIVETVIIIAAVVSPLALVALGRGYATSGASDAAQLQSLGASFVAARTNLVGQLLGLFFGLAALLLYYLLYESKLVPRFISVWGFVAVLTVMAWNLLELFGREVSVGIILAAPMILNEVFLAVWLIVKGFDTSAKESESAAVQVAEA